MKKINLLILILVALLPAELCLASSNNTKLMSAPVNLQDKGSLQRGAKMFVNYCQGCHSAEYMRYNRLAKDLGIVDDKGDVDEALVKENLIFGDHKIGDNMVSAMLPTQAAAWFGVKPPDLTLKARARGADWLYTYLLSFYKDDSRRFGVNNLVFKAVGMPHVLAELQGVLTPEFDTNITLPDGTNPIIGLKQLIPGEMTPDEYKQAVADLVNFLVYISEPAKLQRTSMGVWVLLFTALLFVFAYLLKREYWKDVH